MTPRMCTPAVLVVLLTTLGSTVTRAAVPSDLPPEAARHNARGIALVTAGDYEAAVGELQQAYRAMPDVLGQRTGRGNVLGALRSALHRLYLETRDPRSMCLLQTLLREHIEALLLALGDSARPEDVAGSLERLRQVDVTVGTLCSATPTVTANGHTEAPFAATPAPPTTHDPDGPERRAAPSTNPMRTTGAVLLGLGVAGLGVMAVGIFVHTNTRLELAGLTRRLEADDNRSESELAAIEDQAAVVFDRGRHMRTMAIVGGVFAGASLISGAVLRGLVRRRSVRMRVAPVYSAGQVGLQVRLAF